MSAACDIFHYTARSRERSFKTLLSFFRRARTDAFPRRVNSACHHQSRTLTSQVLNITHAPHLGFFLFLYRGYKAGEMRGRIPHLCEEWVEEGGVKNVSVNWLH